MGRKKHEPQRRLVTLAEKEIEEATKEVKLSILRLVQAQVVWERITGTEILENSTCNCLAIAIEQEKAFRDQKERYKELDENVQIV